MHLENSTCKHQDIDSSQLLSERKKKTYKISRSKLRNSSAKSIGRKSENPNILLKNFLEDLNTQRNK